MMTLLVTVDDDGACTVNKMADSAENGGPRKGLLQALSDAGFETAVLKTGDRVDIHVKVSDEIKRDVIITLLDDTVPMFASTEEAEAWMSARRDGPVARYG